MTYRPVGDAWRRHGKWGPGAAPVGRLAVVAGTWSVGYGLLVLASPGVPFGFPFGTGIGAELAARLLVLLCLGWAVAAALAKCAEPGSGPAGGLAGEPVDGRRRRVLVAVAWSAALLLLVVVPTNLVMQVAFAEVSDWWGFTGHALALAGGVLWSLLALAYQRRTGPGCDRCGRTGDRIAVDGWVRPPRWLRRVGTAAVFVPLIGFVLPHWLWAAGIPFGTVEIDEIREVSGSLWVLGAIPAAGALLTTGLTRRWGQVFPSWLPFVGDRPVPRLLAVVPALVVAVLLVQYGVLLTGCSSATLLGVTDSCHGSGRAYLVRNWAFTATYPVFLTWGATLGVAAVGYHLLTRRRCPVCHQR